MTKVDATIERAADPLAEAAPRRPTPGSTRARRAGTSPFLVVGAAFATGIALAKLLDWRSHANPQG